MNIKIVPDEPEEKLPFSVKLCPIYWMCALGFAIQDHICIPIYNYFKNKLNK